MEVNKGDVAEEMEVARPVPRRAPKKSGPKRMSGYQFFLRACLDEMKARYPDSSIVLSAVSKLCAENWQNMSDEIRQRFYDQADAVNKSNIQIGKVKKPRRAYKKRPLLAFQIFCKERRHELKRLSPHFSKDQIVCKLANMWLSLDPVLKLNYEKLSRKQFELYHRLKNQQDHLTANLPEELPTGTSDAEIKDDNEQNEEVGTSQDDEETHGLEDLENMVI